MSTDGQEFLYRQFFKLKVYASHGDSFQNLFSDLMTYYDPAFQAIAPWGSWGDGGNDGWIPSQGHYFQVYGPKPTTSISETVAVKKAVEDFDKLPEKWLDIKNILL
ncbi:hypothetical protein [Halomonas aestuarii]|uniref:hypothetical protein n=1 Tax=Halomonas aestuarii TaxID=1897729 RepID=UPI000F7AA475|nr:hypothetical protein [Halomonas aestuarii]